MVENLFLDGTINRMKKYISLTIETKNARCIYDELKRQSEWMSYGLRSRSLGSYQSYIKEYERQTKQKQ